MGSVELGVFINPIGLHYPFLPQYKLFSEEKHEQKALCSSITEKSWPVFLRPSRVSSLESRLVF